MKKTLRLLQNLLLLTLFVYSTACNGKSEMQSQSAKSENITPIGQPKLINSQGTKKNENVSCGLQDRNGNLWFGTGSGVYRYDGKLFFNYTTNEGLNNNSVKCIMEDKAGNIWFGTTDGICYFDGKIIKTIAIPSMIRPFINNNDFYNLSSTKNTVWSMLQDKSGKIWFGTGDGVYIYNGKSFTRFLDIFNGVINKENLHLKMVDCILEDKIGNIWFASGMPPGSEGLIRFDGTKIESFKPQDETWIRKIIESKNGDLIFATRIFGILSYNGKSFNISNQPKGYIQSSLNDILEDKNGILWVASDYGKDRGDTLGGLWKSNLPNKNNSDIEFTKITNKEVVFILEDKNGNIWFGTRNTGLYKYDGKTITNYSE